MNRYFLSQNKHHGKHKNAFTGIVFKYIRNGTVENKTDTTRIVCEVLDTIANAYPPGRHIHLNIDQSIEVTDVYNKILWLIGKMEKKDLISSQLHTIRRNFKKGIYPTKSEFKDMNKYWNLITKKLT